ncbi:MULTISPECIES: CopG family transcriptional regulator [Corynebacterium]|uniref:CopG family transcriptional regulator n=1 Tax=Corynebacterium TaxID=1716 RepID=UPI002101681D|nr:MULTISPECIES: CopG family transcriptional regulator [Corynebacterium]UUA88056.1 CopG family transcriptional regulator [Corynebacterium pseudogenitalium]
MKTINGKLVSEEQIDAWVTEAEKGYDVETLRRRGRKPRNEDAAKVISIRLSPARYRTSTSLRLKTDGHALRQSAKR